MRVYSLPDFRTCWRIGPGLLLGVVAGFVALLAPAAWGQGSQSYNCIQGDVFVFPVPDNVTSLTAILHGAHGSYPDEGTPGAFGGVVQANLSVTPGQLLYVWVGCIAQDNQAWGYGNGGFKGDAPGASGDGGFGGGGSAVTSDPAGDVPLLVAGGGGGGGGNAGTHPGAPGGQGGNGGFPAEAGEDGGGSVVSQGGCADCQDPTDINGGDGTEGTGSSLGGGGGGGGGGYPGGAGGQGANDPGGSGGGGGGGTSFADSSATEVAFATSQLTQSGLVVFSWPAGPVPETDGDTLPDAVDQCEASDLSPTVVIDTCDSGALNDLDADGCTIADRIAAVAADAANHGQFVSGVAQLTQQLQQQRAITSSERQALLRCAAKADLP